MNLIFPATQAPNDLIQGRLMKAAAVFMLLNSAILTLSPAVRLHSWQVDYKWIHWIGFFTWIIAFSLIHHLFIWKLPDRDPYLLPLSAFLSGWGLLTIWRLNTDLGLRQTAWLFISLGAIAACLRIPDFLALLRRYKYIWLIGGLLLTGLTFFFGTYPGGKGPDLWLGCCGFYLQPSEPLKLLLIIYLAAYFSDRIPVSFNLLQLLLPTLFLIGSALAILVAQRDLGTASIFLLLYFIMIYLASGKLRLLITGGVSLLSAGWVGYLLFDVIRLRMNAWINPWLDPSGRSYQVVQSLIAFASGQILGRGLGLGSPGVVPISHSDFIFTAIGEEYGLLGSLGLVLLVGLVAGRGFVISIRAVNRYHRYLAAGATVYLVIQSILIMGGNTRLLPLTGVTLPFVSYGGSSLLTSFMTLFVLLLISSKEEAEPAPLADLKPFILVSSLLLASLLAAALIVGWWSFIRSDDLFARTDNPRRSISDRFVPRGTFVDRNNTPIVINSGKPGDYLRKSLHPSLSHVIGYTHPLYGQAGLEASLDAYLRGIQGSANSLVWSSWLIYGQSPPGLDVRLSIDLKLQEAADQLLVDNTGALVLINARTGEILALVSNPGFDTNKLDEKMPEWITDKRGPLLNRVTQGTYPPGSTLGPFLLNYLISQGQALPATIHQTTDFNDTVWDCPLSPTKSNDWGNMISNGCPGAISDLADQIASVNLVDIYRYLGLMEVPPVPLEIAPAISIDKFANDKLTALGQGEVTVSPLQMALAAAILSSEGTRPVPLLAMAVNNPQQGWIILPSTGTSASITPRGILETTRLLSTPNLPTWETTASAYNGKNKVTWFIGGTQPDWKGTPLALTVVIESDSPSLTQDIGRKMLKMVLNP